jgi:hypothetical protein
VTKATRPLSLSPTRAPNFLYAEPRAIPEPATLVLLAVGLLLGTVLAAGARFRLS